MLLEGKVSVVTGRDDIGREVSKLLTAVGARVVVNNLGVAVEGSGGTMAAADMVVQGILAVGGTAVANYQSVTTPEGEDYSNRP